MFVVMVKGDARVICGLHVFVMICMLVFDDAALHNNEPKAVRRIEDAIRGSEKGSAGKGVAICGAVVTK